MSYGSKKAKIPAYQALIFLYLSISGAESLSFAAAHPISDNRAYRLLEGEKISEDFEKEIPNFQGMRQLGKNLCWAASVVPVFKSLTGADLNFLALANLGFHGEGRNATVKKVRFGCQNSPNSVSRDCDATGEPEPVLHLLGIGLPKSQYPREDTVERYRAIKDSLANNVPVIIGGVAAGALHVVQVYGISLKRDQPPILKAVDPYTGAKFEMEDGVSKQHWIASFFWNGYVFLGDYRKKGAPVIDAACEFLMPADFEKHCKGRSFPKASFVDAVCSYVKMGNRPDGAQQGCENHIDRRSRPRP